MTEKKRTVTQKIQDRERLLPALRYTSPNVAAFFALLGSNVANGFTSVGTRMCQTLYPFIKDGIALLRGNRGTSGATGRWQALLGVRASDLTEEDREAELIALLVARAMPNERQIMGSYMLAGLSSAELTTACTNAFGDAEGKAFSGIVKAVAKFVSVSSEIVQADIKKKSGKTQNLTASASGAIADARQASAQAMLDSLMEAKAG